MVVVLAKEQFEIYPAGNLFPLTSTDVFKGRSCMRFSCSFVFLFCVDCLSKNRRSHNSIYGMAETTCHSDKTQVVLRKKKIGIGCTRSIVLTHNSSKLVPRASFSGRTGSEQTRQTYHKETIAAACLRLVILEDSRKKNYTIRMLSHSYCIIVY